MADDVVTAKYALRTTIISTLGGFMGALLGFGGAAYATYDTGHRAAVASNLAVRKPAYINFLKLSDIVINAKNGEKYEQTLRVSLAQVQLLGSKSASLDAPDVATAALEGREKNYVSARAIFINDARADLGR